MADLDLATRRRLADALRSADADTLMACADVALRQADDVERLWTLSPNDSPELQAAREARVLAFRRLAALALGISELLDRAERMHPQALGRYAADAVHPAALASLLDPEAR